MHVAILVCLQPTPSSSTGGMSMQFFALALGLVLVSPLQSPSVDQHSPLAAVEATPLAFDEFLAPSTRELKPSAKLAGLNGRRVRMVGFMAHMESPPAGAFYLCPRPT